MIDKIKACIKKMMCGDAGRIECSVAYSGVMSRRIHALAVLVIVTCGLFSLGAQTSCSSSSVAAKRVGEPCTRTSECQVDLVCASGVCRAQSDASTDAGADD